MEFLNAITFFLLFKKLKFREIICNDKEKILLKVLLFLKPFPLDWIIAFLMNTGPVCKIANFQPIQLQKKNLFSNGIKFYAKI